MKNAIRTVSLVALMSTSLAFGQASEGHGREGGDPTLLDKADVYLFLDNDAKEQVARTVDFILKTEVDKQDQAFKAQLQTLKEKGLLSDVEASPYRYEKTCVDKDGNEKGASTEMNEINGSVCWSIDFIMNSDLLKSSDLIGLAYHEHIHHFGIVDADHQLGAKFKKYYNLMVGDFAGNEEKPRLYVNKEGVPWLSFPSPYVFTRHVYDAFEANDANADYICRSQGKRKFKSYETIPYSAGGPNGSTSLSPWTISGVSFNLKLRGGVELGIIAQMKQVGYREYKRIGRDIVNKGTIKGLLIKNLECK